MPPTYIRAYAQRADAGKPGDPIRFVASTSNVARDGLIIEADGWQLDNYRKNPVFLWAHNYREPPIGRAEAMVEGDRLIADVTFDQADDRARQIEQKYRSGFLNAVSVGWDIEEIAPPKGMMGAPRITKADLLEISGVPVPSDPDALAARQRSAEQADTDMDWQSVASDMTALYCFPLARPIRAWRASYHALARSYAALGKEPPERLSPEYLASLDTEALAGLFLEDESERCADVFRRHQEARAQVADLPPALRERLTALRALCDALLLEPEPRGEDTPTDDNPPADDDDQAEALSVARRLLERWSTIR